MITLLSTPVLPLRLTKGCLLIFLISLLSWGLVGCLDPVGDPGSPPLEEELSSDGGLYEPQRPSSSSPYGGSGSGSGSSSGSGSGGSGSSLKSIELDANWIDSIAVCLSDDDEDENEEECEEESTHSHSDSTDDE